MYSGDPIRPSPFGLASEARLLGDILTEDECQSIRTVEPISFAFLPVPPAVVS